MVDIQNMTDEELEAIANAPDEVADLSSYSDEELARIASSEDGVTPQEESALSPYLPSGETPIRADIKAYEDQGGGFAASFGRGIDRLKQSASSAGLVLNNVLLDANTADYERLSQKENLTPHDKTRLAFVTDHLPGQRQRIDEQVASIKDVSKDIAAAPMHPDTQAAMQRAKESAAMIKENGDPDSFMGNGGFAQGLGAAAGFIDQVSASDDKWGVAKDLIGEQVPVMAATVLGSKGMGALVKSTPLAGTLAGEAAVVGGGAGIGSFTSTYGSNVSDALQKGMKPEEATKYGAKKSAIQALVDAGTGAIVPVKIGSQIVNIPAQTAIQMIGGGGGEYLASIGVGEIPDMADVVLNGVLEAIGLPGDMISASLAKGGKTAPAALDIPPSNALPAPAPVLALTDQRPESVIAPQNEQGGGTIYAQNPQPKLANPDAYPTGQFSVDSEGGARRMNESDVAQTDAQRGAIEAENQRLIEIGLSPDVVRAQWRRENPSQQEASAQKALPSPDAYPSNVMQVDARGIARPMNQGEIAALDRRRKQAEKMGLTPDVIRSQERAQGIVEQPNNPAPAMPEVAPKQPWQMTKDEYVEGGGQDNGDHFNAVAQALLDENDVPAEITKEYPDLKKQTDSMVKTIEEITAIEQEAGQQKITNPEHAYIVQSLKERNLITEENGKRTLTPEGNKYLSKLKAIQVKLQQTFSPNRMLPPKPLVTQAAPVEAEHAVDHSKHGSDAFKAHAASYPPTIEGAHQAAMDYVIDKGNETGNEYMVLVSADGVAVSDSTSNDPKRVRLDSEQLALISDPYNEVSVHHNHPSNGPLSGADIFMLSHSGLKVIAAHGKKGNFSAASLTDAIIKSFSSKSVAAKWDILKKAYNAAYATTRKMLQEEVNYERITPKAAGEIHGEIINRAMAESDIIKYTTSQSLKSIPEHLYDKIEQAATKQILTTLRRLGIEHVSTNGNDRRTNAVRPNSGIASLFGRVQQPSGKNPGDGGSAKKNDGKSGISDEAATEQSTGEDEPRSVEDQLAEVGRAFQDNPTLYSNAFLDPAQWKAFYGDVLKPLFGWTTSRAQEWKLNWETTTSLYTSGKDKRWNPLEIAQFAASMIFRSEDGLMAGLAAKFKSPTILAIKDALFAEGGVNRAIGTSYQEATERRIKTNLNKLGRILEPFGRGAEGKAQIARIVKMIENPALVKAGRSNLDDAAIGIAKLLTEERNYMIAAGLDVGLVEGGYFPAMYDTQSIIDDSAGFLDAATAAYQRTYPTLSRIAAREMAESWLHNVRLGDVFVSSKNTDFTSFGGAAPKPNSMKERVFTKESRDILRDKGFTITDPVTALQAHFARTAPKAEFERRFGTVPMTEQEKQWKTPVTKWQLMKEQLIKEGAAEAIPHIVKIIKSSTGNAGYDVHPMVRKVESYARLMSVLSFLPRAAVASLHESSMAAVSTGSARAAVRAFGTTFKELYHSSSNDEIREISEDLVGTTEAIGTNMLMEQRTGGHVDGQFTRHIMQNFFKYTGLHHLTNAQRIAALESGQFMLRQLAADIAKRGNKQKSSEFFMQDLGVEQEEAAGFAKWISNFTDGKPTKADLQNDGKYQQMYITALQRHVDRTIMNPNASTRPYMAKYPIVSLAYNLQSFIYAFSKNVLIRNARLAGEATKRGYTAADRLALVAPTIMMAIPFMIATAVGELRDEIWKDPASKPKDKDAWSILARGLSRFGIFGAADPWINMVSSLKYQRDPATALVGPLGGNLSTAFKNFAALGMSNSENTNTAERNAAKSLYSIAVQPTLNLLASLVPVPLAGAAGIQAVSHPAIREKFISAIAGEKQEKGGTTSRGGSRGGVGDHPAGQITVKRNRGNHDKA